MAPRNFYEDEQAVAPVPGTAVAATEAEVRALGPNKIINGSSVRSPSFIQSKIELVRQRVNSLYASTNEKIDNAAASFKAREEHFTTTLSNLHHKDEDLLVNGQYIVVAGLSGLIFTRRSNVVLKTVVPVTLALLAFRYTMPQTWNNTLGFAHNIEKKKFPQLAVKRENLYNSATGLVSTTEATTSGVQKDIDSKVAGARDAFKKFTGLRIDEDATK